jgi:hypothetical protein
MAEDLMRPERLQIMLSPEELKVIDDFRFRLRMPSLAAAVRELLRRGLKVEGFEFAEAGAKSQSFGVLGPDGPRDGDGSAADRSRRQNPDQPRTSPGLALD